MIHIDGDKVKCPSCKRVYLLESGDKLLYRNISVFYENKKTGEKMVKCRSCKEEIKIS